MGDLDGRVGMKALTPLSWCEFRGVAMGQDVDSCDMFAGLRIEGMAFCEAHGELISKAIEDSGVQLVQDLAMDEPKKLRKGA